MRLDGQSNNQFYLGIWLFKGLLKLHFLADHSIISFYELKRIIAVLSHTLLLF